MARFTVQEQAATHKDFPPLAAGDPNLILDVDFTAGQAAVEAILETTENLAKFGTPSGEDYDSTLGLNPNRSFHWQTTNWTPSALSSRTEMYDNGGCTIYYEVQRSAIAATWKDDGTNFIDNNDGPSVNEAATFPNPTTAYKQIYDFRDGVTSPYSYLRSFGQVTFSGGNPLWKLVMGLFDTGADNLQMKINANVPSQLGDFIKVAHVLDANNKVAHTYLDGRLVNSAPWSTSFGVIADGTDIFQRPSILGNYNETHHFSGYIRRMQVINRPCKNLVAYKRKVAVFGDSIVQRANGGYGGATPATEAAVLALQTALDNAYAYDEASASLNPVVDRHYMPWMTALSTISASEGAPFQYYIAGDAGAEYATTSGDQIESHYVDAVNTYNPEIVIMMGSVNDVAQGHTAAQVETGTKAIIDSIIAGASNLQKILFLTTPPAVGSTANSTAPQQAIHDTHVAMQNTLGGYGGVVEVFDLFTELGGHSVSVDFAEGSHTNVSDWDTLYTKSKEGADVHPGMTGMSMIAEKVWPKLKSLMFTRATS